MRLELVMNKNEGTNVVEVFGESAWTYFIVFVSQMKMEPFAEPAATYRESGLKHTRVLSDPEKYSGCLFEEVKQNKM